MANLYIITNEWNEQQWFNTGGTRAKKYFQSPDGKFYYFKRSQLKPGKDYTFEFWNEIIAYELGTMLGFNMLQYDIAIEGDVMGCICESMIDSEQEELIEGVKYLQAYSPDYDPAKKEHQKWYTFNLIERALQSAKIGHFIDDVIKIIIFDSLIGNRDRHQENWAAISRQELITDIVDELEKSKKIILSKTDKSLFSWAKKHINLKKEKGEKIPGILYKTITKFSPIYDSGSSLGRELLEERVNLYLNNPAEVNRYIEKGSSEIHWDGKKCNHFELIGNLLQTKHATVVNGIIISVLDKYNNKEISRMIHEIDKDVPMGLGKYK
ncbi:MAG: hypothetical protein RIS73_82, partial [Bacteroidota bacterium]